MPFLGCKGDDQSAGGAEAAAAPAGAAEGEGEGEPDGAGDGATDPAEIPDWAARPELPALPAPPQPLADLAAACPAPDERFPSEEWITALAAPNAGPRRYVDPGAGRGGDGSRQRPFSSLGPTFDDDPPEGMIVVLAAGEYPSGLGFGVPLSLVGACPSQTAFTEVASPPPGGWGAFHITGAGGVILANMTLRPDSGGISVYQPDAPVILRRLVIDRPESFGVYVVDNRADVTLEDVRIVGVQASGGGQNGIGFATSSDGPVTLRQVEIEGSSYMGVSKFGLGLLDAQDLSVRNGADDPVDLGWGVYVGAGRARLERVLIAGTRDYGLLVSSPDDEDHPEVEAVDVTVRGVFQGPTDDLPVVGVEVSDGGRLSLRRALVEAVDDRCLLVRRGGHPVPVRLDAEDLTCREVRATPESGTGAGLVLLDGAGMRLRRTLIEGVAGVAVLILALADPPGPTFDIEDLTVRDGRSALNRDGGRGLALWDGAVGRLARVVIEDVRAGGVWVSGWGRSPETNVTIEDLTVDDVDDAECHSLPADDLWACRDPELQASFGGGLGILVNLGARARIDRFSVRGARLAGVVIGGDSVLRADHGVITANDIGLNHRGDAADLDNWFGDVRLFDNRVDFARERLPLPNPGTLIER